MPWATLSRVSKPYQLTPEIRKDWLDGLRIWVPLVRHPPGTPATGVGLVVNVGVGPDGVGVFVGGLPAAITVLEGMLNKVTPIAIIISRLRILNLRVMIFSPFGIWMRDRHENYKTISKIYRICNL